MIKKVLVTGSAGFIGKNLICALKSCKDLQIYQYDINNSQGDLKKALLEAEVIFHLAGVNRPKDNAEFSQVNTGLTDIICRILEENQRRPRFVFASSTQAELDNPYGVSKKAAEEVLRKFQQKTGADVVIYRLPGVFGKWSQPNYNTVVATFCYNIARNKTVINNDPSRELTLVYIDDVVQAFVSELKAERSDPAFRYGSVKSEFITTLGELETKIRFFRDTRNSLLLPEMFDRFTRCLYATYLSFLPTDGFAYSLPAKEDERGSLAEFIKLSAMGQIFVSRTKPGKIRGNHFHHTKVEKFLVLKGKGIIRFRRIDSEEILEYPVDGKEFKVVDIPPGYTHSIENVGECEMITLFWAGEIFNPEKTDTTYLPVQQ